MKITLEIPSNTSSKLADQLTALFQSHVENELRMLRGDYRIGDVVLDDYNQVLQISEIFEGYGDDPREYELSDLKGRPVWTRSTSGKFSPFWPNQPGSKL